jgi:L-asparaginase II
MNAPLICEVTRGTMVESRHSVHALICDSGGVRAAWGEADLMFYPRSAIKFMQALPLVESGAAEALKVSEAELALASASHSGEPTHVEQVAAWLQRLGLGADDLGCGAHMPYDDQSAEEIIRAGTRATRLHNNCSGKHTGFLATARHLGEAERGYLQSDHPVQRRLYDILTEFGEEDLGGTGRGVDGCGIPVYGMTLLALARSAQKMSAPGGFAASRRDAIGRILAAVRAYPYLVAGRGRFDTDVMRAAEGGLATKGGAEGVHVAILPDQGLGIALKAEDGNKRAAEAAMGWLLTQLGVISQSAARDLEAHLRPVIRNAAGEAVGSLRIAAAA